MLLPCAGDAGDRCAHGARKQLDIAEYLDTPAACLGEERQIERQPRRGHDADRLIEQGRIETTGTHLDSRIERTQLGELRWRIPGVRDCDPPTVLAQIARAGQTGAPEPGDDGGGGLVAG